MTSFDLIHEEWIPIVREGQRDSVGIADALLDAHTIDGLALDDPLEAVAVFRQVLLPVALDALGVPRGDEEWSTRWDTGQFAGHDRDALTAYLDRHRARFDLFHACEPFAQVAGLRTTKNETKPVSLLISRLPSGNNVPMFAARVENDPPALDGAQAARALLSAQCWDTAAIKAAAADDPRAKAGKTTGNPTGPLGQLGVVIPLGPTLFHTLLLNTPIVSSGRRRDDRPWWDRPAPTGVWTERPPAGLLDLLTWQSRRIRLIPDDAGAPAKTTVSKVVLTAGDRLGTATDLEPHTAWRRADTPKANEPSARPVRHQPGRAAWRGLEALLATSEPTAEKISAPALLTQLGRLRLDGYVRDDLALRALTVGVRYGNQQAVIEDVMVDAIPLPVAALLGDSPTRTALLEAVHQADQLRVAANRLGDALRQAEKGDKIPWDKGQRLGDILVHSFTPVVRRILGGLQRHPHAAEQASNAWRTAARQLAWDVAEPVLAAAGPGTFLGREPDNPFGPRLAVAEVAFRRALNDQLGPVGRRSDDAA